jgi:hypothetical protein
VKLPVLVILDELFRIDAAMTKQSGMLRDIGNDIKRMPGDIAAGAKDAPYNIGRAAGAFTAPGAGLKAGLQGDISGLKNAGPMWKIWQAKDLIGRVNDVAAKEDKSGQGRSRIHRAIQGVASQAGGWLGRPFGVVGGIAGTTMGGSIGNVVGKGVDKVRGYKKPIVQQQYPRG